MNDTKRAAWEIINTPEWEEDLSGSPPTMEAKQLHWSMLEAKAGWMHTCLLHKQQENFKEILPTRHGRESIEQGPSVKVVIIWGVTPAKGLAKGPGAQLGNLNLLQKEI